MKRRIDDLAIVGAPPAFPATLHVGRPNVGDRARLIDRINDIIDRRFIGIAANNLAIIAECISPAFSYSTGRLAS